MDPNSEKELGTYQDYPEHIYKRKKNREIMIGLENRGTTSVYMWRHFDETLSLLFSKQ